MRRPFFIIGVPLVLVSGIVLSSAHYKEARGKPEADVVPPAVPVVAGSVSSRDVPIYLGGVGTVIAYNNVIVRSQITGEITRIAFEQGQKVKKGDLLAEIDPRPYQAQLEQATANRDRDQAQLTNARANLNRYTPLLAKGYATQQLVDTQKAQVAQLEAMVASDEALIHAAKVNLDYTRLLSPLEGVSGIRQIDQGNVIHPTDPNGLVDVTQVQPISVIFTLPQTSFPEIQQEMGNGTLTVLAYSQDNKVLLDAGKLLLIDNQILQTTGTIRLRADFPNVRHTLWPGELVNARLLLRTRPGGLTIAASAVQQGPEGPYVYVIAPDNTVAMRPVVISQIDDGQALVDTGLSANERVVTDGQYRLEPGSRVTELHGAAAHAPELQSAVQQAIP